MSQPPKTCTHNRLRGPQFLGENGAYCVDCGENLPCPHPPGFRDTDHFLGGGSVTTCRWCGEEMPPSP